MLNLLKVLKWKNIYWNVRIQSESLLCCQSKVCSDALIKKKIAEFLTIWVHVETVMFAAEYSDCMLYIFCLHLTQFILSCFVSLKFTNYVCKQITIHGWQLEFPEAKVIKLGVEHYDYNTSCGNNNIWHNDSDHACLNSIILWLCFLKIIFIMIFNILLLLILSL